MKGDMMPKSIIVMGLLVLSTTTLAQETPEGMVLIPGTLFQMGIEEAELEELAEMGRDVPHMSMTHSQWWFGDEIPMHTVSLDSFFIDIREVTNSEYREFVDTTDYNSQGEWEKHTGEGLEEYPVVSVTWADAAAYAAWAGKRLPTEAEWEYAARGGTDYRWFTWGNEPDPELANYRYWGESFLAGFGRMMGLRSLGTTPVASYPPNGYGLYDMLGNVSEWMEDDHRPYPAAPEAEDSYRQFGPWSDEDPNYDNKVIRGGSWETPNAVFMRITGRSGLPAETHRWDRGFRCASGI